MIIDSHCHLDYEPMFSNLEDVIKRAKDSNVKFMLTISVVDKKYNVILDITKKFSNVYGTYGIHPHEAKNHNEINKENILIAEKYLSSVLKENLKKENPSFDEIFIEGTLAITRIYKEDFINGINNINNF